MSEFGGRCLCGQVRWSSPGPVTRRLVCYCETCRRATSSPMTAFIAFAPASVIWLGRITHFQSSPGTFRGFCPDCGARLYFRSDRWPEEIHIHAATQEDGSGYAPDAQVFCPERPDWLDRLPATPAHDGFQRAPASRAGPHLGPDTPA